MTDWESWIGRTTTRTELIDALQANHMMVLLDREPTLAPGDPLPPAWHWLYFHDVVRASQLGEEGHPELGITMPPVPLPRRMWAGGSLEFLAPLPLGCVAERRSTVTAIIPKTGHTGPLFFVTVEHVVAAEGRDRVVEQQTIVYREMSSTAELPSAAPAPTDATFSRHWPMNNTTLFRYSALTFNGHRIHYDADYARSVEGYPNVIVHGPLLATLLLDLAAESGHGALARFTYRAKSPVFLPSGVWVSGREDEGGSATLWASSDNGGLAMEATVAFA